MALRSAVGPPASPVPLPRRSSPVSTWLPDRPWRRQPLPIATSELLLSASAILCKVEIWSESVPHCLLLGRCEHVSYLTSLLARAHPCIRHTCRPSGAVLARRPGCFPGHPHALRCRPSRSAERRVGIECFSPFISRCSPDS